MTSAPRPLQDGRRAWSLRSRLARASLLVSLLGTLLILLAGSALGAMARTQEQVSGELFEAVVESAFLFRSVLDQQSAVQGYSLSGDRASLALYEQGMAREQQAYDALRGFYVDDPQLRDALDKLHDAAVTWRRDVATPRIAAVSGEGAGAVDPGQLAAAEQTFEQVREANEAHRDLLLATREQERRRLDRETWGLAVVFALTALAAMLSGLALWRALRRWVTDPLDRLASEVRQVQSGNLRRPIAVQGPREIVRMGADVEAMRQRVVEQYGAAVEARQQAEVARSKLQEQTLELERSNRDLEQFAYVASHDLQEPLRKVASFCQMLERRYRGQLDERADTYIGFAVDGAKRMQVLINDLLAFSRVGRITTDFTNVDLNECLRRALRALEEQREQTAAQVNAGELPVVRGEASLLTQLFQNLIGNAIKFARPGVPPRIDVEALRDGDQWRIVVRDNGIGIEPQYAEKIFVIFQRLHAKEDYGGTGIGLALCKRIVEYHGGSIELAAPAGEGPGTTIQLTLPALASGSGDAVGDPGERGRSGASGQPAEPGAGSGPGDPAARVSPRPVPALGAPT